MSDQNTGGQQAATDPSAQQQTDPAQQTQQTAAPAGDVAALQKIVEAQKAAIGEMAAKVKALTEAGMSAEQKAAAELEGLKAAAAKAERYDALIAKRRDEALGKLPEAVRAKMAGAVEGLDADRALELIEAAGLVQTTTPTVPAHAAGAPATKGALPTVEQISANPDLIMTLKPEERAAILSQIGIKTGGGTLFGN